MSRHHVMNYPPIPYLVHPAVSDNSHASHQLISSSPLARRAKPMTTSRSLPPRSYYVCRTTPLLHLAVSIHAPANAHAEPPSISISRPRLAYLQIIYRGGATVPYLLLLRVKSRRDCKLPLSASPPARPPAFS